MTSAGLRRRFPIEKNFTWKLNGILFATFSSAQEKNLTHFSASFLFVRCNFFFISFPLLFCLKWQCHTIFCFIFSINNLPSLWKKGIRLISNFSNICGDICESMYQWYRRQICQRCQQHLWQIMETMPDCWHLKVNLKEKIYLYANSTTQNFYGWRFHLLPVTMTLVLHLELRTSLQIFETIWNNPKIYSRDWEKLIYEKDLKSKISWHCP
jgi:hypothetical protein